MRFLLFNVAVIGALAYLFLVERDEPSAVIAQVQNELHQAIDPTEDVLEPVVQAAPPATPPEAETAALAPEAKSPLSTAEALLAELPPLDDPAVEQRRREVLVGLDEPAAPAPVAPGPITPAPIAAGPDLVLAEGESLMSSEERVKQLHVLAEEMELLYVQSLAE